MWFVSFCKLFGRHPYINLSVLIDHVIQLCYEIIYPNWINKIYIFVAKFGLQEIYISVNIKIKWLMNVVICLSDNCNRNINKLYKQLSTLTQCTNSCANEGMLSLCCYGSPYCPALCIMAAMWPSVTDPFDELMVLQQMNSNVQHW